MSNFYFLSQVIIIPGRATTYGMVPKNPLLLFLAVKGDNTQKHDQMISDKKNSNEKKKTIRYIVIDERQRSPLSKVVIIRRI